MGTTYVASDWHGGLWVWNKVKEILQPDDTLYFLGDAADRGSDGWEMMKDLLNDPRVIYIKGNHDQFLLNTFFNYNINSDSDNYSFAYDENIWLWFQNGGQVTYEAFLNDPDSQMKYDIIQKLKNLPYLTVYHNTQDQYVLLSHAGFDPEDQARLTEYDYIWNRSHYIVPNRWHGAANQIIVHGHTPIPLLIERQQDYAHFMEEDYEFPPDGTESAYWYAQGHKLCIDCGTVWTDIAVLVNLDTWEEIVLKKDED